MLCTNGHNNADTNTVCAVCGVNTFQPPVAPVSPATVTAAPTIVYQSAPASPGTSGYAIASLVLGIVWIVGIGSVLAIIFALLARKQIATEGKTGGGMATAGLVLGIIGVIGAVLYFILIASVVSHISHMTGFTGFSGN